jgi:serine/threonine-protein kinase
VWAVRHVESSARYALKALHRQAAGDRMTVERFVREARAAATLSSRHVVKIIDAQRSYVDPVSGYPLPFLVMEFLDGCNLEQLLALRGPLSAGEAIWALRQVARALDVAHGKQIVHRDLKPENLFLARDEDGQPLVKVCDFGIAKMIGGSDGMLSTGALGTDNNVVLGTPMYMSPEQIRDATSITAATDQWAVGLIAYKMLVGRDYFGDARSTGELLAKILGDAMPPPSSRNDKFDARLDAWFARSCSRDAAERFPSVGAQIEAFAAALSPETPRPIDVPAARVDIESTVTGGEIGNDDQTIKENSVPAHTGAPSATTNGKPAQRPAKGRPWIVAVALAIPLLAVGAYAIRGGFAGSDKPSGTSNGASATTGSPASATIATNSPPTIATTAQSVTLPSLPSTSATELPTASVTATASVAPPTPSTTSVAIVPKPKPSVAPPKPTGQPAGQKLPKGAACTRASECASGYCFAEQCQ